ncbi:hypothetical protein B0H10DRAFT_2105101 [Mycena sp. CBHHK59/15]|nr:hypothetical protein B0H10DRAFT_2105101 [Mycena sp. CBHHK59/15]
MRRRRRRPCMWRRPSMREKGPTCAWSDTGRNTTRAVAARTSPSPSSLVRREHDAQPKTRCVRVQTKGAQRRKPCVGKYEVCAAHGATPEGGHAHVTRCSRAARGSGAVQASSMRRIRVDHTQPNTISSPFSSAHVANIPKRVVSAFAPRAHTNARSSAFGKHPHTQRACPPAPRTSGHTSSGGPTRCTKRFSAARSRSSSRAGTQTTA